MIYLTIYAFIVVGFLCLCAGISLKQILAYNISILIVFLDLKRDKDHQVTNISISNIASAIFTCGYLLGQHCQSYSFLSLLILFLFTYTIIYFLNKLQKFKVLDCSVITLLRFTLYIVLFVFNLGFISAIL